MKVKTSMWMIILSALVGMSILAVWALYEKKQSMINERKSQISQHLEFLKSQLEYYYRLEVNGKLSRTEAQSRAIEAISAQRSGNDYFFIRTLTDDYFVYHPDANRMGKNDAGGALPDGRSGAQAMRDAIAKSKQGTAYVIVYVPRPHVSDKTLLPKLLGVAKFEPWGWMPSIGFYIDDIDRAFWKEAVRMMLAVSIIASIVSFFAVRAMRNVIHQLGGEPQYAAECMQKIARGDFGLDIEVKPGHEDSMMASLKIMQMKLKNISTAIQDNADELGRCIKQFDWAADAYLISKSNNDFARLKKYMDQINDTTEAFNKAMRRIKI